MNVKNRQSISLKKKMIIQLLVCACIYGVIFFIKNNESKFSNQVISNISSILSYDINIAGVFNNYNNMVSNLKNKKTEDIEEQSNLVIQQQEEAVASEQETIQKQQEGIENQQEIVSEQQENQNKTQMELDAEYIKQNYNFVIPVNGNITSGFGDREPTEIISAFHQGIDIGAVTGTEIKSAIDGNVIYASVAGDYGNCIKIQNGDVVTVYAHCSELNVNVGDNVTQNQIIGRVGATRKSNWSTFTF